MSRVGGGAQWGSFVSVGDLYLIARTSHEEWKEKSEF